MRRREFIAGIGGAVAALPVRAQQPAMPVIGYLTSGPAGPGTDFMRAARQGLSDTGFDEGRNVRIEYRWAERQNDRLPVLAADLVRRQVSVILARDTPAALAAKAATTTIPIVFSSGADPVEVGLVASLNRPGGNLTGVSSGTVDLVLKRLELLHELVPTPTIIGLLVNPTTPNNEIRLKDMQAAAEALGVQLHVLHASTERDFDTVFASLVQLRAGGLVIQTDPLFTGRREQLGGLAFRNAVPTIFQSREFAAAGGLMSYGGNLTNNYRLAGTYAGRILKGEKPSDLPVQQTTKIELTLNLKTAKALGLTIPETLLATADEVIQ
jgi:putative tryptophan/tyrosine transport system substrate-binding protein